jgi:hypothetical protein
MPLSWIGSAQLQSQRHLPGVGSWQGRACVPDGLLVHAEALDGEEAVCAWLVQHHIRLTAAGMTTAVTDSGPREATR